MQRAGSQGDSGGSDVRLGPAECGGQRGAECGPCRRGGEVGRGVRARGQGQCRCGAARRVRLRCEQAYPSDMYACWPSPAPSGDTRQTRRMREMSRLHSVCCVRARRAEPIMHACRCARDWACAATCSRKKTTRTRALAGAALAHSRGVRATWRGAPGQRPGSPSCQACRRRASLFPSTRPHVQPSSRSAPHLARLLRFWCLLTRTPALLGVPRGKFVVWARAVKLRQSLQASTPDRSSMPRAILLYGQQ